MITRNLIVQIFEFKLLMIMKFLWLLMILFEGVLCLFTDPHILKESSFDMERYKKLSAVKNLQEYIRIDSSKIENYDLVVEFWQRRAREVDLPLTVYRPAGLPVCVLTWLGARPHLPAIMINTHSDVVPAHDALWKYPPFSAFVDSAGDLFGRGAQDCKSLAIQHFEAIRELKDNNITLLRTVHLTIMPDEETGGFRGIKAFVDSGDFEKLNVGFALDEGFSSPDDTHLVMYLDRRPWQINMTFYGQGGHGSAIKDRGVAEKLGYLLNYTLQFQKEQKRLMAQGSNADLGRYTSANVNVIRSGIATNVISSVANAVVDIRLATDADLADVQRMVDTWQNVTGPGTTVEYLRRDEESSATALDDSNPYWIAMKEAAREMNIRMKAIVCPATTDMSVLRRLGIPALGFAPCVHTTSRIHDQDEYINVGTFLRGIRVVKGIVRKVADLPAVS